MCDALTRSLLPDLYGLDACRRLRELLKQLRPSFDEEKLPLLIFVNKGIETSTQALSLEIIADTCGADIAKVATFIVSLNK